MGLVEGMKELRADAEKQDVLVKQLVALVEKLPGEVQEIVDERDALRIEVAGLKAKAKFLSKAYENFILKALETGGPE